MKIPLSGETYNHPTKDVNAQRSVNLYPAEYGPRGQQDAPVLILEATPGLLELVNGTGEEVRAIIPYKNKLYAVIDSTFYEVTLNTAGTSATLTSRGTITTSSTGIINWDTNPTQIMMVDGTSTGGWVYTPANTTLTQITDADFTGGVTVVFIDSYFIYNTPNAATIYASAINDGTSISALDVVTAEGYPDNLVALEKFHGELWAFGEQSIEIWYNAANPTGFPFSRRQGAFLDIGCSASNSVVRIDDNALIWLDQKNRVVQAVNYNTQVISNPAINAELDSYAVTSDAIAYSYEESGHVFYVINFPTANKTWCYDLTTQLWHERAYRNFSNKLERHLVNCITPFGKFNIAGARNSGKIYILSKDYYDDAGDAIQRLRSTGHFSGEYELTGISELELHAGVGKGLVTGQGSDPQIMMRYSNDGGYTWSNELWRSLGKLGNYSQRVRWNRLGTAREWLFEFSYTEPTDFTLIESIIEVN